VTLNISLSNTHSLTSSYSVLHLSPVYVVNFRRRRCTFFSCVRLLLLSGLSISTAIVIHLLPVSLSYELAQKPVIDCTFIVRLHGYSMSVSPIIMSFLTGNLTRWCVTAS
jgi:hypothetical protein